MLKKKAKQQTKAREKVKADKGRNQNAEQKKQKAKEKEARVNHNGTGTRSGAIRNGIPKAVPNNGLQKTTIKAVGGTDGTAKNLQTNGENEGDRRSET